MPPLIAADATMFVFCYFGCCASFICAFRRVYAAIFTLISYLFQSLFLRLLFQYAAIDITFAHTP